jgi:SAM-dependent methyltransferase
MNNSRFASLFPDLHDPRVDAFEQAYPEYRLQRVHAALRGKWEQLCYEPVWSGQPLDLAQLRRQSFPVSGWSWLLDNTERILPSFHQDLMSVLAGKTELTRRETFQLMTMGLLECDSLLMRQHGVDIALTGGATPLAQWQSQVQFPRKFIINDLVDHLTRQAPLAVSATLLHGSLADGRVIDGFSDCDLLLVLRTPRDDTGGELEQLAEWVLELNHWLLAYNPCMHHGPMMIWEAELKACSPSRLPPALLDGGVWLQGGLPMIHYSQDRFSALVALSIFEWFYEATLTRPDSIGSAFDVIWWTANTSILTCLLSQVQNQQSLTKRLLFEKPPALLPDKFHRLLISLDGLRTRLGEWVAARLPDAVWPLPSSTMPGACLHYYKQRLRLGWKEAADFGLDRNLMQLGRELWEYVSFIALEEHRRQMPPSSRPVRLMAWPMAVCQRPKRVGLELYELARAQFLLIASAQSGVMAVYEFGQVGCPGLSDLDFLVVVRSDSHGIPSALLMENLPQSIGGVMGHDPLFVGEESLDDLGAIFPVFRATGLWGDCRHFPWTEHFSADIQALLVSRMNAIKYPHDLIRLSKEPQTRWVTFLAYLNSFGHIAICLRMMNMEVPPAVYECQELNEQIRRRFSAGGEATLGDLQTAMQVMLSGSVEALGVLEAYWRDRFPVLGTVLPVFNEISYKEWVSQTMESLESCSVLLPPAIGLMAALSSLPTETPFPPSGTYRQMSDAAESFTRIKDRFIQRETEAGRSVSYYVEPPQYRLEIPPSESGVELARLDQLHSPRFQRFMLALNCFAAEHGLMVMTNWSKVWEYPWLWYAALSRLNWEGKHLVDLHSEKSPMPWLIAALGAKVTLIETDSQWIDLWKALRDKLQVNVDWHILKGECLPLPDACADGVTSISVIEHQADKARAIEEVVRLLKPGGLFALSFDICEPEMEMTFPEWNGRALTMREFEETIWNHPTFANTTRPDWNIRDIPAFRQWHLQSAPHHNYAVGAAILRKRA